MMHFKWDIDTMLNKSDATFPFSILMRLNVVATLRRVNWSFFFDLTLDICRFFPPKI